MQTRPPHTLVFPAGMAEGLAFRERAAALGEVVIGASSIQHDQARSSYQEWEHLPFVTDPGFDSAFAALIRRRGITSVYTPHFVVHDHLSQRIGELAPGTRLTAGRSPHDEDRAYRALQSRVAALETLPVATGRPPLSPIERVGLVRLVETIPGMCGAEKMAAIMDVMRDAPCGDVVEIGSWWGRSAALFAWLARRYGIGQVLCVDPWEPDCLPQGNAMLDRTSRDLDREHALQIFEINLVPLASGQLNYLRAHSEAAARHYRAGLEVSTAAFGATQYSGGIAVLHIDGNHALDQVALDVASWTPHVLPHGWIIFDDYEWAFGDGPRQVADAFVARATARIAATYRAGPALFVKMTGAAHG